MMAGRRYIPRRAKTNKTLYVIKNLCLINVHSYKSVQTYKICMINNVQFSDLTMPPSKLLTHEDCREAMCACCGIKTDK